MVMQPYLRRKDGGATLAPTTGHACNAGYQAVDNSLPRKRGPGTGAGHSPERVIDGAVGAETRQWCLVLASYAPSIKLGRRGA
jgi:hypothetical protein